MTVTDRRQLLSLGAAAFAVSLITPTQAEAAAPPVLPERLPATAIRDDLLLLGAIYGRLHPGLHRYLPSGGWEALVGRAVAWADRERTPGDVFLMLARLTAAVRCGHSHASPFNQRRIVAEQLLGRPDRLPLCTRWVGERLVVTDGLDSGVARGSAILAVDGIATARLRAGMLPLTRADGHNDAKRLVQLELHRGDRFALFDVLRPLLHPTRADGTAVLRLRDAGGTIRTLAVPTGADGQRGQPTNQDAQQGWRFQLGEDGVGVLTMPDWALYNSKWDWQHFLDETVDSLIAAGARALVIDLRENEGGLDCGDPLLARLVATPLPALPGRRLVRYRETPVEWRPLLDTWDPSFHTLGKDATPAADGFFALPPAADATIVPTGRRFAGKVVALVGPVCSSATFQFAERLRRVGGTLVGEPTGGNRRGINGGGFFFVRLPGTGLEVDLPLIGYFPTTPQPDAGLLPDVPVAPSLADIAAGRDPALTRARAIAAQA